jgi:hypothetical protein
VKRPCAHRESGLAVIETLLLGLLFLVPLIWTLGMLADLHRAALAATAAARDAGMDAARASSITAAEGAVEEAVARAFLDQGLNPSRAIVAWSAGPALERGGTVRVRISYPVTILQAPFLGDVAGPSVWVNAEHAARIDPFRSAR